jgi:hypothetical protein
MFEGCPLFLGKAIHQTEALPVLLSLSLILLYYFFINAL